MRETEGKCSAASEFLADFATADRASSPFTSLLIKNGEREGKNHNGLSTNITRSSFCGGGQKKEEEMEDDGSLSLELPDENSRRDGVHVKKVNHN